MESVDLEELCREFMEDFRVLERWVADGRNVRTFDKDIVILAEMIQRELSSKRLTFTFPHGFREAWQKYQKDYSELFVVPGFPAEPESSHYHRINASYKSWAEEILEAESLDAMNEIFAMGTGYGETKKAYCRWAVTENVCPKLPKHTHPAFYERNQLFVLISQAQRALVFGAPLAALSSMRAVLEDVLKNWLKVPGEDLCDRVNNLQHPIVSEEIRADFHRLRHLANAGLHVGKRLQSGEDRDLLLRITDMALGQLDAESDLGVTIELISLFSSVNALVEEL